MSSSKSSRRPRAPGVLVLPFVLCACSDRVDVREPGPCAPTASVRIGSRVSAVDIVLGVDNSRDMEFAQALLASSIDALVHALVNPSCLNANGVAILDQPASSSEPCPAGSARPREPITDIHLGVVTSSLGGLGSDACPVVAGLPETLSNDDAGHLVSRSDPTGGEAVPTYEGKGFLAWDPGSRRSPPGEADEVAFVAGARALLGGVGALGCGYESQLESVYRFLVDPEPYASIFVGGDGKLVTGGVDQTLLTQRRDFLRPDSMLLVVTASAENDCSVRPTGQYYLALQTSIDGAPFHLPRARATCAEAPWSACCRSCGQPAGLDEMGNPCPEDPSCGALDDLDDPIELRCYDQKRRFGIDFLHPTSRYVEGFTAATVTDRAGQIVPNPLFTDLDPSDDRGRVRSAGLVHVLGLVGVPYQALLRDASDFAGGFRTASELDTPRESGHTTWDLVLGDPESWTPPLDPHMVESVAPRSGWSELTGAPMEAPDAPLWADPVNGHELGDSFRDLQFACITALPEPLDCSEGVPGCDCYWGSETDPRCAPNPDDDGLPTLRIAWEAKPGLRQLAFLRGLGSQGHVGSICATAQANPQAIDFGYVQVLRQLVDDSLGQPVPAESLCLPRALDPDALGRVDCQVIEATVEDDCRCDGARRPAAADACAPLSGLADEPVPTCYCEITQVADADLEACRTAPPGQAGGDGYCYVDGMSQPPLGDPALTDACLADERRLLRFVGTGRPKPDAQIFVRCPG